MNHQKFINSKLVLILLVIIISNCTTTNGQPGDIIEVSGSVYMIRSNSKIGNPSSIISVGNDGVLIVDTNLKDTEQYIRSKIDSLGSGKIKIAINTHIHADHTEGNINFGKEAVIISSKNLRKRELTDGLYELGGEKMPAEGLPEVTIDSETNIYFNNEEIKLIALSPGHTDGDLIVYFVKSKVLCTGDYFFVDKFPVMDYESGADLDGYLKNINYMLSEFPDDVKIIPGHGYFENKTIQYFYKSDFKKWFNNIKNSVEFVKFGIENDYSLDEIIKTGLPESIINYGAKPRFMSEKKWIEAVFNYYTRIKNK